MARLKIRGSQTTVPKWFGPVRQAVQQCVIMLDIISNK
jgi:hypothetical protein